MEKNMDRDSLGSELGRRIRVTKKFYREFKKWLEHYRGLFGLNDWDLTVGFECLGDLEVAASTHIKLDCHHAEIVLNTEVLTTSGENNNDPRKVALHEILHIALAESNTLGSYRYLSLEAWNAAHEREVVLLTNVIRMAEGRA